MQNPEDVQLAASELRCLINASFGESFIPRVGIILGTGLSEALAAYLPDALKIPFSGLPNFPQTGAISHQGSFLAGFMHGLPVLVQCGRVHIYEGFRPETICMGVRVMRSLGCDTLFLTNAAGSLNPLFPAGNLMCIRDLINHTGLSPLTGPNHDPWGERFPDMTQVLDRDLAKIAAAEALRLGIPLFEGIYIGVHGPEMETPAETRMYRQWGADAVGMSTVLEAISARHLGMKCLGLSCLTNLNLPDCMEPAPISEVLAKANLLSGQLAALISQVVRKIGDSINATPGLSSQTQLCRMD